MKKIIAVAVAAAALGCSCIFPASATDSTTCSKSFSAKDGQVVTTKIYVALDSSSPTSEICGVQAHLQFDPDTLKYTDAVDGVKEEGNISTEFTTGSWFPSLYPIYMPAGNFLTSTMDAGSGYDLSTKKMLSSVDFDVTKAGVTSVSADIQELYANNDELSDLLAYGKISLEIAINGYSLGDVTTDNNTSISDAIALQKRIAGISKFSELQECLGDVNGDGTVSISDAICVQKKIAGIIETL
ncbi:MULTISPECIES: dockerin type I domain-containing protein [unclassified Ruminococcus]|uniref:dockerin type I domain-containing protein n=1 Tax=unclassified Ruminococcus TaxID=2608920 RepID=UPI0021086E11|nr:MULTISPECIES: dockerin type I domain-containing protein [unclassified Ruminococcus]MCQ4022722.1 hypothetical protein [Ruminococcus sp. zg-924]MCQ4114962.1 hypothetical protein [Ruminococcus sp. zg-921]